MALRQPEPSGDPRGLVLDTDIGSDVDDALALGVILGSPELNLLGITTVYGDTMLRARLARRLCRLAGQPLAVRVVPGSSGTLTGREVWWAGHEGAGFSDLADEPIDDGTAVADYLAETVSSRPGEVDLVAIGPLTNLALALQADPQLVGSVRHVFIMGGDFRRTGGDQPDGDDQSEPEHNFASDPEAAASVFASELPITVTGLDVTNQVKLSEDDVAGFVHRGPLGEALGGDLERWWRFTGGRSNVPHDPLALLTLLRPELFRFAEQPIRIEASGRFAGRCVADPERGRAVRVTVGVDVDAARTFMIDRLVAACRLSEAVSE